MFRAIRSPRRLAANIFAVATLGLLAACDPVAVATVGGNSGQKIDATRAVPVALLVPGGSGKQGDDLLAKALENAARLAIADLNGVEIDLRVYNTAGNPANAARQGSSGPPSADWHRRPGHHR